MYKGFIKRAIDLVCALAVLIVTFPLYFTAILILVWVNKGSPFFIQVRPGKNGVPFKIVKLKTMVDLYDSSGSLLPDSERLTTVGKIIRKSSLDEIPQLLNVLLGQMSLIGPRPLLMDYLSLYDRTQARRHEVRPGITGWAQVNGRNNLSWKERFEHDVFYVDHLSFALDMKIIFMTIKNVVTASDVNQEGSATMEKFTGQREQ